MNKKIINKCIEENNTEELLKILEADFSDEKITEFKSIDFLVDLRGNNKYIEIIKWLELKTQTPLLLNYLNEIELVNEVFCECRKLQEKLLKVPAKYVLSLMIYYATKQVHSTLEESLKNQKKGESLNVIAYEKCGEKVCKALKSLVYDERIFKDGKFLYIPSLFYIERAALKYQKSIVEYISDSFVVSHWCEKYNLWKKEVYSIQGGSENQVHLNIKNKERLIQETAPYLKHRIYSLQYEAESLIDYELNEGDLINDDKKWMEYISQKEVDKHFYCESSEFKVEGVEIKYWIKAYFIVNKLSNKNKLDNIFMTSLVAGFFVDLFRCKTRKSWVKIFIKNGIPKDKAEILFDHMIYSKTATDLYDYPFIPVKNKFTVSRAISEFIHPAKSVISRFNSKDIKTDNKGRNFEINFRKLLEFANIPFVKLHNKVDNSEYECDAVFYMDDAFVFCECKCRTGHELETINSPQYIEDVKQINRIADFYKNNMNYVFDAFEKKGIKIKSKKFYKTFNFVIHSQAVDGVLLIDDTYVMDFNHFVMPLNRSYVWEEYVKDKKMKKVFEGEFSIYKLLKFFNYKFYIYDYRNKIKFINQNVNLGAKKLVLEDYYVEDFFNSKLIESEQLIRINSKLNYMRQMHREKLNK